MGLPICLCVFVFSAEKAQVTESEGLSGGRSQQARSRHRVSVLRKGEFGLLLFENETKGCPDKLSLNFLILEDRQSILTIHRYYLPLFRSKNKILSRFAQTEDTDDCKVNNSHPTVNNLATLLLYLVTFQAKKFSIGQNQNWCIPNFSTLQ